MPEQEKAEQERAEQEQAGQQIAEQETGQEPQAALERHPDIAPLAFLLGRWLGAGVGGYPEIESFRFGEEITFGHNGKPFLIYSSRTWLLDDEGNRIRPSHLETGFWRVTPDGRAEVMLAHPTGITEIYLGEISGTKIELATEVVARTSTAKEVRAGHRLYGLVGQDLAYAFDMAAMGQPLQPHLSAQLKRSA
jgi:hypothetical protein